MNNLNLKKINNVFDEKSLLAQQINEKRLTGSQLQKKERKSVTQIEDNNNIFLINEKAKTAGINPLLMDSVEESSN